MPGPVAGLLAALDGGPPLPGGGRLLCIDGPPGAGKTSLARELADVWTQESRTVAVVHMDALYDGWDGLRDPGLGARIRNGLVVPWASGTTGRCPAYDWALGRFEGEVEVAPADLMVLEGVGSGMRGLADLRTVLAWVQAPRQVATARGLARDRALHDRMGLAWDEDGYRQRWERFSRDADEFFDRHGLPATADLVVDGLRASGR
ncbi:4-amino-4-deoxy-L-arabinose transferase [Nocardioides sp. AE5]|uniref:uridine kinase family protein n=1 Tax=Nocardioides sp. AE5 TaxID=2962573 RepID=UPI0028822ED0|nr:4-amino-4-deoxy-L-arabinose transferase [Nocardioides sp. AE5]MDT0201518.1 4-amino-4-deoxy-L-arabinose transferase [Nocardioides sp. AE5]